VTSSQPSSSEYKPDEILEDKSQASPTKKPANFPKSDLKVDKELLDLFPWLREEEEERQREIRRKIE